MIDKQLIALEEQYTGLSAKVKLADLRKQLDSLEVESQAVGFWSDNLKAQSVMRDIARLDDKIKPFEAFDKALNELKELNSTGDPSLETELNDQANELSKQLVELKEQLKLAGPYDDYDAILSIYAGAGGTDAQDWAQMLLRMYSRWAEKNGYKVRVLDQAAGEEAGLKSATLELSGDKTYGKLKSEHGVHRLVRLSPFNADNLRQTSFARVDVVPKIDRPDDIYINDKDLRTDVYRSGGHGGQSVNTTDSAVRITHLPTGLTVAIQNERSQLQNKDLALTLLRSKLVGLQMEQHTEKLSELKGPAKSAEWGNQIRSYVLHPYKQVKDLRTNFESSDPDKVLDGDIEPFIEAYLNTAES